MYFITVSLIVICSMPGILANMLYYDQRFLNATIEALVMTNGPLTGINEGSDRSNFWLEFDNGMHIIVPCDYDHHYYSKLNACIDTSKMGIIYDHCQFSRNPDCWNEMPFCFFNNENGKYKHDNCLPYFKRNEEKCRCELVQ
ncbi:uncharacterized protein LOC102678993 [Apis dorsata]|uniref:uncharacterized protein LOC102678993 n=1 Tax=Apis dorsata TaxID=7462 RepID=UPI0003DF5920|nr:uncharacterized protein LOC102678993 [Apis dorsata]